eukprot:TRINITY_DN13259_c0_g1_i1.p1 TRINITY_DN13259_c0_g1~~TRINITY_DN13259_c0_g1_i1.p1  ORF type:complete len:299 (-),score=49.84 TRINITY_DN13259_c0_g1_i1:49-945(-)
MGIFPRNGSIRNLIFRVFNYITYFYKLVNHYENRMKTMRVDESFEEFYLSKDRKPFALYVNDKLIEDSEEIFLEFLDRNKLLNHGKAIRVDVLWKADDIPISKMNTCEESSEINLLYNEDKPMMTIYDCFKLFETPEHLNEQNEWYCSSCKAHRMADKHIQIFKLPEILIIHLKRFRTITSVSTGETGRVKISDVVDFPIEGLDLTDFVLSRRPNGERWIYDLYALTIHYGTLNSGHYIAYAKNPQINEWYEFDDSRVRPCAVSEIKKEGAYVLFYHCLLYTSPSPRDRQKSRMPSSA